MATAVVGCAFEGSPENGVVGVKIAFTRAQATKIAQKMVKAYSGKNETTGAAEFRGPVKRRKGDAYSVDTCVTGSNEGTSDDPKFALLVFFRDLVFKRIQELVGEGGIFEGYTPVIQGDQAGPHEEEAFKKFVKEWCEKYKWLWEPQAPQMPHMNVLDLAVFPSMSSRHSKLSRAHSGSVIPKDDIWRAAESVWRQLPEVKIARAFILAWRLASVVIAKNGANTFLNTKELHQGITKGFHDGGGGRVYPRTK